MAAVDTDCRRHTSIDQGLSGVTVGILLGQPLERQYWVFLEEVLHLCGLMGRGVVDEEDHLLQFPATGMSYQMGQMPTELDITAPFEAVPDDVPSWPAQADKAVDSLGVAQGRHPQALTVGRPAALHLGQ